MGREFKHLCMNCLMDKGSAGTCPVCGWQDTMLMPSPIYLPLRTLLHQRFLVGRVISETRFSINYIALDIETGKKRVIREFFPREVARRGADQVTVEVEPEARKSFQEALNRAMEEGQILKGLAVHPGFPRAMTTFLSHQTACQVRDHIAGMSFTRFLRQQGGILAFESLARIMNPVLAALEKAHEKGILHLNLHPDNIIIAEDGTGVVIQFGAVEYFLFRRLGHREPYQGWSYTPPELLRVTESPGPASDIYAAAALMYQALTGRCPPMAPEREKGAPLPTPSRLGKSIPIDAEMALMRALALRPLARFQDMEEFRNALLQNVLSSRERIAAHAIDPFMEITCSFCGMVNEILITDFQAGNTTCFACDRPLKPEDEIESAFPPEAGPETPELLLQDLVEAASLPESPSAPTGVETPPETPPEPQTSPEEPPEAHPSFPPETPETPPETPPAEAGQDGFTLVNCPVCHAVNEVLLPELGAGARCVNCGSPLEAAEAGEQPSAPSGETVSEEDRGVEETPPTEQTPEDTFAFAGEEAYPPLSEDIPPSEAATETAATETLPEEELAPPPESAGAEAVPPEPSREPGGDISPPESAAVPPDAALVTILCPICRSENRMTAEEALSGGQCRQCGHRFLSATVAEASGEAVETFPEERGTPVAVPGKSRSTPWIWMAAAVFLLLAGGGYWIWQSWRANQARFSRYVTAGDVAFRSGRFQEALQSYENALGLRSDDPYLHKQIARIRALLEEQAVRPVELTDTLEAGSPEEDSLAVAVSPPSPPPEETSPPAQASPETPSEQATSGDAGESRVPIINVRPGDDLALVLKHAPANSIIRLKPGSHRLSAPLEIRKPVQLQGSGADFTLVVAEGGGKVVQVHPGARFTAFNVGFSYQGSEPGDVLVVNDAEVILRNCTFKGAKESADPATPGAGIRFSGNSPGTVESCTISDNAVGIFFSGAAAPSILQCDLTNNTVGVKISGSAHPVLRNNQIHRNSLDGVMLVERARPVLERNTISHNRRHGISLRTAAYPGQIRKNAIVENGEVGIALEGKAQAIIEENTIEFNQQGGIRFTEESFGIARKNTIRGNRGEGIRITDTAQPIIRENKILSNRGDGIEVLGKAQPTIERNEIIKNGGDGISLLMSKSGGIVRYNQCVENQGYGISILKSGRPTLANNTTQGNYEGHIYDEENPDR
ncbi:MAG: hypothetical protein D6681_08680 [Calditrichaeota bacterium]|nr:MAG: hypothetical protein D6681_08680 [Calditrichota bacterium]